MTSVALHESKTVVSQEMAVQEYVDPLHRKTNGNSAPPIGSEERHLELDKLALVHGTPWVADPQSPVTLPALLRQVAASDAHLNEQTRAVKGTGEQLIYVQADGMEYTQSYAGLLTAAEQILAGLRQHGLQPQAKVILQLRHNQDILPAFWGCILGGFIPVMTAIPPTYREANNDLERFKQVWQQLCAPLQADGQPLLLTDAATQTAMADLARWLPVAAERIATIEAMRDLLPDNRHYAAQAEDVAFFSLTSGSTGAPKLIQLTHRNLLTRARAANHYCGHTRATVTLNWLPLEHIGPISDLHLRAMVLGCQQIYATRGYVVGSPLNWLRLIHRYRATYSAAPNFAYVLINNALEKLGETTGEKPAERWDLSCVETLLCAGETVSPQVIQTFLTKLAPHGLKSTAVQPAFGMAEMGSGITYYRATSDVPVKAFWVERASLAGTVVQLPPHAPASVGLTSLGSIISGLSMRIVNDTNQVLSEGVVGRFQVKGVAVSPGYYQNPLANQEMFLADGWFDTGDLGMIMDGELVLTGRAKESIIVNGANYANSEIEAVVEELPGVARSYTVACAVRMPGRDHEEIALFFCPQENSQENDAEATLPDLLAQIRQTVTKTIGIRLDYLIPLTRAEVPKTAIGKLQRIKLAKRLEAGDFDAIRQRSQQNRDRATGLAAPRTALERRLVSLWQEALQIAQVGIDDNFFALGGASLNAARLITRLQEEFHDTFHVVAIFNAPTIAELAAYLEAEYPTTIAKVLGLPANGSHTQPQLSPSTPLTAADVAEVRRRLPVLTPLRRQPTTKNPAAIFVLAAGRSGSTLLRVMLAGHPQLFAPPELVLLCYETLAERETALTGESSIWREGVLKAITQVYDWSPTQAEAWLTELAAQGTTVQALYRHLQQKLGDACPPRILVEKTPQDTLNLEILRRAELYFDQPRYIHLTRHPHGAIHSFAEARLDQLMYALMPGLRGAAGAHKFSTAALGEVAWLISQQNILTFLQDVPPQRQQRLQFETLVRQPRQTMETLCDFLGIDFVEGMVQPYQEKNQRMTTGLHAESRMLGDVKFHHHKGIDAGVADRWQASAAETPLGDLTWAMAEALGYERPEPVASPLGAREWRVAGSRSTLTNAWLIRPQPNPTAQMRLFCFHYAGGSAALFQRWPLGLPANIELCAVQLPGRGNRLGEAPFTHLNHLTTALVDALQPELDRPFAFFGYSMGGVVAFETARALRRRMLPLPLHLMVAARRAPHLPQPHLAQLPDHTILATLRAAGNAIPQELAADQAVLQLMLPTLRADFRTVETYRHSEEAPLACPITVLGGIDDEHANADHLAGWRQHTSQSFQVHRFEGGHFFLHSAESALVQTVAQALTPMLAPEREV